MPRFSNRNFLVTTVLFQALLSVMTVSCQPAEESAQRAARNDPPLVYVFNHPLEFFAERIGGNLFEVVFPVPGETDPVEWVPSDEVVREIQRADLILLNGAGFEGWTGRFSLPSATADTSRNFRERLIVVPDAVTHSHGHGPAHAHDALASIIWMDPSLAIKQARAVREVFSRFLPAEKEGFQARFELLALELLELDGALERIFGPEPARPWLASHPIYQYMEARYGLNLRSLHWEPDEMPLAGEWTALDRLLETHPARIILWEAEPLPETVARLEERGVKSLLFPVYSHPPAEGDFLSGMWENAARLKGALGLDEEISIP